MLSIADPVEPEPGTIRSVASLPALAIGAISVWYVMHWGQLHGWFEGRDILIAFGVMGLALSVVVWIIFPALDSGIVREGLPRLLMVAYGGFVQYFNASDMGVYGGLLVNFSAWMRAWLVISLSVGAAVGLALGRLFWWGRTPGYGGATFGLIILASGMALSHHNTLNWPFWELLNPVEFHWFAAPQHWQLAPPRFLMGFGSALVLLSMSTRSSADPAREATIRPLVEVVQFGGGAFSIGVLVTVLQIGHQIQYSYVADRGFIQTTEQADRAKVLVTALSSAGASSPERQSQLMLYQAVNYQADNLVFAEIYGGFFVASLVLAGCCTIGWIAEVRHTFRNWKPIGRRRIDTNNS